MSEAFAFEFVNAIHTERFDNGETVMNRISSSVSIVIPVYNCEEYIEECLNSICAQTYPNIEIICIDDGSTDRSAQIITQFVHQDNRIQYIQNKNHGVASARNLGLSLARGDYLMFVDADDTISDSAVSDMLTCAAENEADVVISRFTRKTEMLNAGNRGGRSVQPDLCIKTLLDYSAHCNEIPTEFRPEHEWVLAYSWGRLYAKKLYTKYRFCEDLIYGEDVIYIFDCFLSSSNIVLYNKMLYFYRENIASATSALFQPRRLSNTMILCNEIQKRVEYHPKYLKAAYQFVTGRVMHCYSRYFKQSRRPFRDQILLLSQPFVSESVIHGRDLGYPRVDFLKAKIFAIFSINLERLLKKSK